MSDIQTPRSSVFESLHPDVQRWIWKQGWTELRDVQEEAARVILSEGGDVVIASATASGKTEAAFLPIGSLVAETGKDALVTLYVSPLKALINDQHRRLESFFEDLQIPVHRWHGDVGSGAKQKLTRNPAGVLLITPESLEALFIRRGTRVPGMFAGLRHVVVDELHAFIGSERGRQLQSLLHRVDLACRRRVPRIALSATLGDMGIACDFLRPGAGDAVQRVISTSSRQSVQLQIRSYLERAPRVTPVEQERADAEGRELALEDVVTGDMLDIARDLFSTLRGGRHIVFTNARRHVETFTNLLTELSDRANVPNEFWPHHGSLDKSLRTEAETALRDGSRPATVLATTTLELGIDVGSVESIAQIGAPPSVASMRQRLGRSGRRGSPSVLRIYVREPEITVTHGPVDQLRPYLVQSIAMVRLLAERWYEPPHAGALHLSTLVQQTLSLIAQHGAARADQMWSALCRSGPFTAVDAQTYGRFLRDLARHDLIVQTADGEIVLGLEGERLVDHYEFYSAFVTAEEYRLVSGSRTLGTLPVTYPLVPEMHILFGGRRWRVVQVEAEKKVVDLAPAGGGRAPNFDGGAAHTHTRIREEMRRVLEADDLPPYVDAVGHDLLGEARRGYERLGLRTRPLLTVGEATYLFPWTGDRAMYTMGLALRSRGLQASTEHVALRIVSPAEGELEAVLQGLASGPPPDPLVLARVVQNQLAEKHHGFLGPELLAADYAAGQLDAAGAHEAIKAVVRML